MSPTLVDSSIVPIPREAKPLPRQTELSVDNRSYPPAQVAVWGSSFILVLCVLIFAVETIHWPLAGDASLMHYVVFLMGRGSLPYQDIADINLPGSYLIDYTVMQTLGGGSLAWRLFDLLLMLSSTLAMISIARPYGWFAGVYAGSLLTLLHGADGIYQLGQRDLVIAVLLLVGYAALFRSVRTGSPHWVMFFGLCAGMATTIKPTFFSLGPAIMLWMIMSWKANRRPVVAFLVWGSIGWLLTLLSAFLWLYKMHVLVAFIKVINGIVLFHATLARKPPTFLLLHSFAPLMVLVCLWVCSLLSQWRHWKNWEGIALLIGVTHGLASYLIQGKGYPYQRYPFLALLLLMMAIDFTRTIKSQSRICVVGWAAIALGTFFFAPGAAIKASHYNWRNDEFSSMLQRDLNRLGGSNLSGHVQCLDSVSGCFGVLYTMRLVAADGYMYDEFLFREDRSDTVVESRRSLWRALEVNPPKLIVVTDTSFPSGPENFRKLEQWPDLSRFLQRSYFVCAQRTPPHMVRWWSRTESPRSYRIYCAR